MGIFNTREVNSLRHEVNRLEEKNRYLKDRLDEETRRADEAEGTLRNMSATLKKVPEDCTPGEYCEGCVHAKLYLIRSYPNIGRLETGIYCGKGESCKNFIQKKVEEK